MNASKTLLPVILVGGLALGWISYLGSVSGTAADYNACIDDAEESLAAGLYEQAIEHYKASLSFKASADTHVKIKEAYDLLFAEEPTDYVRSIYLEDMAAASLAYPKNAFFWETQIELHLDGGSDAKAYETAKQARNYGASSERVDELYYELLYAVKTDYKEYSSVKTALNGYLALDNGGLWFVNDEAGEAITSTGYTMIGLINDDGKGIYVNNLGTRLLDKNLITRVKFDFIAEDAGYYNEKVDLVPVKIDGKWRYALGSGGLLDGEYELAGSFYGSEAAAFDGNSWYKVSTTGETTQLSQFDDIKLDLYGCHIQGGVIIASEGGKYNIYSNELAKIGSLDAEDIDICVDGETVAFKKGGKWGFASVSDGSVIIEPAYAKAKSFSSGYAAVMNAEGLWGFIKEDGTLVIPYTYYGAHYFNANESCLVSTEADSYSVMRFKFE